MSISPHPFQLARSALGLAEERKAERYDSCTHKQSEQRIGGHNSPYRTNGGANVGRSIGHEVGNGYFSLGKSPLSNIY